MDNIDGGILAALGLKLVNLLVACVTSFVSLRFFDGLNTRDRWITFVGGVAIAAWGAAPLREYFELKPGVEVGIVVLLGLFGMSIASEVVKLVRDTDWIALIRNLRGGGGGGDSKP